MTQFPNQFPGQPVPQQPQAQPMIPQQVPQQVPQQAAPQQLAPQNNEISIADLTKGFDSATAGSTRGLTANFGRYVGRIVEFKPIGGDDNVGFGLDIEIVQTICATHNQDEQTQGGVISATPNAPGQIVTIKMWKNKYNSHLTKSKGLLCTVFNCSEAEATVDLLNECLGDNQWLAGKLIEFQVVHRVHKQSGNSYGHFEPMRRVYYTHLMQQGMEAELRRLVSTLDADLQAEQLEFQQTQQAQAGPDGAIAQAAAQLAQE